jgi:hypothetical protein
VRAAEFASFWRDARRMLRAGVEQQTIVTTRPTRRGTCAEPSASTCITARTGRVGFAPRRFGRRRWRRARCIGAPCANAEPISGRTSRWRETPGRSDRISRPRR